MSTYYYIGCENCKELLHVAQGSGFDIYRESIVPLGRFLKKHELHHLCYANEHYVSEPEQGYKIVKEEV